jgi:hypothetical protein
VCHRTLDGSDQLVQSQLTTGGVLDCPGKPLWSAYPQSQETMTLRSGSEAAIREAVPEVTEVRDATDHEAGENPFYR